MSRFRSASLTLLLPALTLAPLAQGQGERPVMNVKFGYMDEGVITYSASLPEGQQSFGLQFEDPTWGSVTSNVGDRAGAWVVLATHVWVDGLASDDELFDDYPMLRPIADQDPLWPLSVTDFAVAKGLDSWLDWGQLGAHVVEGVVQKLNVNPDMLGFMLQYAMNGEPNIKEWGQHVPYDADPPAGSAQKITWSTNEGHWVAGSTAGVTMGYSNQKWNSTYLESSGPYAGGVHIMSVDRIAQAAILEQDYQSGRAFLRDQGALDKVFDEGPGSLRLTIQPIILRSSSAEITGPNANVMPDAFTTHGIAMTGTNDVFFAPEIDIAVLATPVPLPAPCSIVYSTASPGVIGMIGQDLYLTLGWRVEVDTAHYWTTDGMEGFMQAFRPDPTSGMVIVPGFPENATGHVELFLQHSQPTCADIPISIAVLPAPLF